jgi:hypothetical protein
MRPLSEGDSVYLFKVWEENKDIVTIMNHSKKVQSGNKNPERIFLNLKSIML